MKPREFDELIRQKFDQDDFAYNPKNWDKLEEQLDGRAKKRSILMWWLMPVAGMAASIALAIGIAPVLHQDGKMSVAPGIAQIHKAERHAPVYASAAPAQADVPVAHNAIAKHKKGQHKSIARPANEEGDDFGIQLKNALSYAPRKSKVNIDFLKAKPVKTEDNDKKKEQPKEDLAQAGYNTFKPEEKKAPKLSIILSGGISSGNQKGYTAGATIRRMINDKLYVESDVAFTSSNGNVQQTKIITKDGYTVTSYGKGDASAKTNAAEGKPTTTYVAPIYGSRADAYDMYYAQITPSLGYKVMNRMSVGVGPDFQQALADNRPAPSEVDKENQQRAPLFDVGFIGKTEYAVTNRVKAAVAYRKGINNILTPMDKFIDRDYVQFQVKCTIFNK